jgi:hypothetical protein
MHKVLVLCQRKYDEYGNILVNNQINSLVSRLLGNNFDIEYVCNVTNSKFKGFVDYDGEFGDNEWTCSTFKDSVYSLIILNTSPLPYMQCYIFKKYLKTDGIIAITIYNQYNLITNIDKYLGNNKSQKILDNSHDYFRIYHHDIQDALLYKIQL